MWSDTDTKDDFLNYSEVANLAVGVLKNPKMKPVSLGVFGTWGTGKSTLLNLIEQELVPDPEKTEFVIVRFDAWLYQGYDDARAALMEVIATTLLETVKENRGLLDKVKGLLKRVNKMRFIGLALEGGALALGMPTGGLLSRGVEAAGRIAGNALNGALDPEALKSAKEVSVEAKGLIEPEKESTPPKEIAAFRAEFEEVMTELGKTLVVFVDNLDRCLPKQTIQTLEALRLFLFMKQTAFVVAADEAMVRHSVADFFKDPDARHVTDYLDKLIQVPMRLPRLGIQEVRAYMFLLSASNEDKVTGEPFNRLRAAIEDNLQASWREEPITVEAALRLIGDEQPDEIKKAFSIADRLAPILAQTAMVQGNPRIIKRLMNVVRMRVRLAGQRSMQLDEALIAKLALFERCMGEKEISHLYTLINESAKGAPQIIETLEGLREDPDGFKAQCPQPWSEKAEMVREWLSLDPMLGGQDLRALAYLSRETIPVRALKAALSAKAAEAVRTLLKVSSSSSPSGRIAVTSIPVEERSIVMATMLEELRKHGNWKTKPMGFEGAMMLANEHPETGAQFGEFVAGVSAPKPPPWLTVYLKNASWAKH